MKKWTQEEIQALLDLYYSEMKAAKRGSVERTISKHSIATGRSRWAIHSQLYRLRKNLGDEKMRIRQVHWSPEDDEELLRIYDENMDISPAGAVRRTIEEFTDAKGKTWFTTEVRLRELRKARGGNLLRAKTTYEPRGPHNIAIGERIMSEMEALGCL